MTNIPNTTQGEDGTFGVRVECKPSEAGWTFFDLSAECFKDQGVYERERAELWEFLDDHDKDIDSGGPFVDQVDEAILATWQDGKRRDLVLADSDHHDMTIYIIRTEE